MNLSIKQRILVGLLAIAAVFVSVYTIAALQGRQGERNRKGEQSPAQEEEFDHLEALTEESITVLFCGIDNTNLLTDVILLARYDIKNQQLTALQIPRDTFVGEGYVTGKINAVYGHPHRFEKGIEELKTVLEEQLAYPIDYTVTITLEGVREIVDAFGGVEVDIPKRMEYLPGKVLEPGRQVLDGEKAEWFLRYRRGYPMGDLGRISAQERFLKAALETVRDKGRMETLRVIAGNYQAVRTDIPVGKLLSIANSLFTQGQLTTQMFLLPGTGARYRGNSVYEVDGEKTAELLNLHFRQRGQEVSAEELGLQRVPAVPAPPPASSQEESSDGGTVPSAEGMKMGEERFLPPSLPS